MNQQDARPLIVTLEFDAPTQEWAQRMREAHFPPERNIVPAHVTLFHALPADCRGSVCAYLDQPRPAPEVTIGAPYLLGRGVAYTVRSPALAVLRDELVSLIGQERLTRQDAAPWRPHLTVQNKVTPEQARSLLETLRQQSHPEQCHAAALRVWRYDGGPWTLLARIALTVR